MQPAPEVCYHTHQRKDLRVALNNLYWSFFMKKSVLASSIAAAVFGLGATSAMAAIGIPNSTNAGDILFVPYYSAQGDNATLLSIVNTDTRNGKAVKVRFRGAANSDDVFDFQVFLSPTDVWTAAVKKGANGLATLTTTDASCTKPAASVINSTPFQTGRLDPTLTGDALASGTREGYIEIIGMADIPRNPGLLDAKNFGLTIPSTASTATTVSSTTNPLWTAIKHVSGVAPCSGTAWTALDADVFLPTSSTPNVTGAALGLFPITGGLMANWSIINVVNSAAWSGQATAMADTSNADVASSGGKLTTYVSQTPTAATTTQLGATADPLLQVASNTTFWNVALQTLSSITTAQPVVTAGYYDFPDASTPLLTSTTAAQQVDQLQANLLVGSVLGEFSVDAAIAGASDWVFAMPTRRYSVAMAYSKISATDDGRRFNKSVNGYDYTTASSTAVFNQFNTSVNGRLICVAGAKPVPYSREEDTPSSTSVVVVSPSTPTGNTLYCGEASVLAFNSGTASNALRAQVAVTAVDATYSNGWATINTKSFAGSGSARAVGGTNAGLPILGGFYGRALNGAQGYGFYQEYRVGN